MEKLFIKKDCQAAIELKDADPLIGKLIDIIGNMEVNMRPDYFLSLARSIIGQQISVAAADAIYNRLDKLLGFDITPEKISDASEAKLREAGLSGRKIIYLKDLSGKVLDSEINLNALDELDNQSIIKILIKIKGIGKWTVEMFLIFSLGRMDVLSLDDIGIQRGAKWLYHVDTSDRRKVLEEKAKLWYPHYTIASFYLWEAVLRNYINLFESIDDVR